MEETSLSTTRKRSLESVKKKSEEGADGHKFRMDLQVGKTYQGILSRPIACEVIGLLKYCERDWLSEGRGTRKSISQVFEAALPERTVYLSHNMLIPARPIWWPDISITGYDILAANDEYKQSLL